MEYSVSTLKTNTIQAATGSKVNIPGHVIQIVHAGNNTTLASNATDTWFKYLEATKQINLFFLWKQFSYFFFL